VAAYVRQHFPQQVPTPKRGPKPRRRWQACNVARFAVDLGDNWSVLEAPWLVRCGVSGWGGRLARR
jgi:hypothetical protein